MLRKVLIGALILIAVGVVCVALGLTWAHLAIRRERTPLPTAELIVTNVAGDDRPVRLTYLNTASQPMPRAAVLDTHLDPHPAEPYVMSHPSFVLEWADGRMLLIDTGMTYDGAITFGKRIQQLGGAAPIEPLGSVAAQLGDARQRVRGVLFTHLHTDHTGGIRGLCKGLRHPLRVFMTEAQAERPNYTTRPGLKQVNRARCVRTEPLTGAPLMPVHGFPGVFVIAAGGHTPGSQIIVAYVVGPESPRAYVFVGDIVNNIDGITYDIPKPFLYRWLVVPEDGARLSELRQFLRELRDRFGFTLLVSHDQRQIEHSGIAVWDQGPVVSDQPPEPSDEGPGSSDE